MKIGYPCVNNSIGCTPNRTFRLRSYSPERLIDMVAENLACLAKTLTFNLESGFLFFRIGSQLVPFASHPVCTFDWQNHFADQFRQLGDWIKEHKMRISMHPDQFVLLNALDEKIVKNSVAELAYHCQVLDLLGMDHTAKVQIHVGGVYGDRAAAKERFVTVYRQLPDFVRARLAIENDDHRFDLVDCLDVHEKTGLPVIFDSFHHECMNRGEPVQDALALAAKTWGAKDGLPMTDYSSQKHDGRKGSHTHSIDLAHFRTYLRATRDIDFDVMLEIKDKEISAMQALEVAREEREDLVR